MRKVLFVFVQCVITIVASAQEMDLDPVTVSSSLTPLQLSQTGRNITVVKGDVFSRLPVHSIDELLRYMPGVEVQTRSVMGSQSDIVLRGGTFQQVLIILDGLRLNDPNTGHFNSYIPIAPSEIDRIEILKGASSAMYGSEAVGGVIHIITKSFAAGLNAQNEHQIIAEGSFGEYSLLNANAGFFLQNKSNAFSAGVISNNSDGQPQRGTNGFFHNNTASASYSHHFNEQWKLSLRTAYDKRRFSAQNFYTTYVSDTAKETVSSLWNQAEVQYKNSDNLVNVSAGYKYVEDEYAFNSGASPNKNNSRLLQALVHFEHSFGMNNTLVTGGQFQNKNIRSNERGNHDLDQVAAFVVWNKGIGKLMLSPAVRMDWYEGRSAELVPQINASYKIQHFQFRGSAGKTIRDADFTERYNNYNKAYVAGGSIGNPWLQAEGSFSYEAGADFFGKNIRISSTVFRREQRGVIDWTPTAYADMPRKDNLDMAGNYALASNIARVNTTGVETDVQYIKQLMNRSQLTATLGLTWMNSESSEVTPSFYISSHARFLSNFLVQYSNNRFALSVNGIYKNRKPQEAAAIFAKVDSDCFMMNTKATVFVYKRMLNVFAEVDNVLDNSCRDLLGSLQPGRWIMGGIQLNIH